MRAQTSAVQPSAIANFFKANFARADLSSADLQGTMFLDATLHDATLRNIKLKNARFSMDDLTNANLENADLQAVHFEDTKLSGCRLVHANLVDAVFNNTDLYGAAFGDSKLGNTIFMNTYLGPLCDAVPSVRHSAPSVVDIRSIIRSIACPTLPDFLLRTGMPHVLVEYMIGCARSLAPQGTFGMLQSTFISYGGPDTDFAQKLNDALLKNGVTTFFFAKDAIPGRKLHRTMRDGVNSHDRVILICSKASLDRPGVVNEITETLQREARDGGKEYLIPITLDDHVFSGWKPDDPGVAQAIRDRVVADFRGADTDKGVFDAGVLKLIGALKK